MDSKYVISPSGTFVRESELYHHGVKGMKWGVRRYQNADGTLTAAGRKRQSAATKSESSKTSDSERNKRIAKKVAGMTILSATVATAAVLYSKNPEAANKALSKVGNMAVSGLKKGKSKAVSAGKAAVKQMADGVKEGVKEGIKEAPKKAAKAVVTGIALNATKRVLDSAVGKEEAARIFQANNGKKISSFWKVSGEDRDDDD